MTHIESIILRNLYKAGGAARRIKVMRYLYQFEGKKRVAMRKAMKLTIKQMIDNGILREDIIMRTGPGPLTKVLAFTDKGKTKVNKLFNNRGF